MAALFTDSAVFEWPAFTTVRGRAGLEAMARTNWASLRDMDLKLDVAHRRVAPDHVTEFGAFQQAYADSAGARSIEYGRYVAVLVPAKRRVADGPVLRLLGLDREGGTAAWCPAVGASIDRARRYPDRVASCSKSRQPGDVAPSGDIVRAHTHSRDQSWPSVPRFRALLVAAALFAPARSLTAQAAQAPEVLLRLDDIGMNHSVNLAIEKVAKTGMPISVSVLFACPWYQEAVEILKKYPNVTVGVHLALNSEWRGYRWGPVLGKAGVPSLVDSVGYFHPSVPAFLAEQVRPGRGGARADRADGPRAGVGAQDHLRRSAHGERAGDAAAPRGDRARGEEVRRRHLRLVRRVNYRSIWGVPVADEEVRRSSTTSPPRSATRPT